MKFSWSVLLLILSLPCIAQPAESKRLLFEVQAQHFALRADHVGLDEVFKEVVRQTGVKLHYVALPNALITAACMTATLKQLMECLLGKQARMVFRGGSGDQPAEIWLLSSAKVSADSGDCRKVLRDNAGTGGDGPVVDAQQTENDKLTFFLNQARYGKATARSQAINYLASHSAQDDVEIDELISDALQDPELAVRSQALASWVARKGEAQALPELHRALHDENPLLRLSSLQLITDTRSLIELALQDEDEQVRTFAALKLQDLN